MKNMNHQSTEHSLYVGDLPPDCSDEKLQRLFQAKFKSVKRAQILRNEDGSSRGFGFIRFDDRMELLAALSQEMKIGNTKLRLDQAHTTRSMRTNRSRFNSFNSTGTNSNNSHHHHFNQNSHHNHHHHNQHHQHHPHPHHHNIQQSHHQHHQQHKTQGQHHPQGGLPIQSHNNQTQSSKIPQPHPQSLSQQSGQMNHLQASQQQPPQLPTDQAHSQHTPSTNTTTTITPSSQLSSHTAGSNTTTTPSAPQTGPNSGANAHKGPVSDTTSGVKAGGEHSANTNLGQNTNNNLSTTSTTTNTISINNNPNNTNTSGSIPQSQSHPDANNLSSANQHQVSGAAIGSDLRGYTAGVPPSGAQMMDTTHILSAADQAFMVPPTSVYGHIYPYGPPPFGYLPHPPQPNQVIPISSVQPVPPNQASPSTAAAQHSGPMTAPSTNRYVSHHHPSHHPSQHHHHHHHPGLPTHPASHAGDPNMANMAGGVQAAHQAAPFYYYYPGPLYFDHHFQAGWNR